MLTLQKTDCTIGQIASKASMKIDITHLMTGYIAIVWIGNLGLIGGLMMENLAIPFKLLYSLETPTYKEINSCT